MAARGFGCSIDDGRRLRGRGSTGFDLGVRAGLYDVGRRICLARLDKQAKH